MAGNGRTTRKPETDLKFSQNWGGKLEHARFTTFRGQDKLYKVGELYPVTLVSGLWHSEQRFGHVRLLAIEFKRIQDISLEEIIADIGRRTSSNPRKYFIELMKDFYGLKRWWDGEYTVIQKLTFEKLGRG